MIRRRRRSSDGGENDWLATYSDMVTLLLAFFVMMFSFSSIDAGKFQQMLNSVQSALGIQLTIDGGPVPAPQPDHFDNMDNLVVDARELVKASDLEQLEQVRTRLERELANELPDVRVELRIEERGLVVRFADSVLFDSGKADLKPEAREILKRVLAELKDFPNHVRVEGHTDNRPIETARFPSNWELSTARATEVIRYLVETGELPASRLAAAGYGEYRPVVSNDTPEGRARNRRVDLVILRLSFSEGEPQ